MRRWLAALLVVAATPALAEPVVGTVAYEAPIALSPDSVLTVQLVDAGRQGAPAVVLAETRRLTLGGPPYAFALEVEPLLLGERRRQLRLVATIEVAGEVRLRTTEVYLLTPEDFATPVTLMVHPIGAPPPVRAVLQCQGEGWALALEDGSATFTTPAPSVVHYRGRLQQPSETRLVWRGRSGAGPELVAVARAGPCGNGDWSIDLVDAQAQLREGCCRSAP